MDEATSALDEDTEQALYALVRERLPGITLISVAHRAAVAKFHRRRLMLHPETRSIEDSAVLAAAVEAESCSTRSPAQRKFVGHVAFGPSRRLPAPA